MKVLFGPENPAGVATALRDGLRAHGHEAELLVFAAHPFGFSHDRVAGSYSARLREGLRAPLAYDVLHWQFGTTPLEYLDAAWGRLAGRPLQLMHYWGDDARTERVARELGSPRAPGLAMQAGARHDRIVLGRMRIAARLCRAAIVSDLELAAYVRPWFARVYVVPTPLGRLDPATSGATFRRSGLIVLHAPSNARTKGTSAILAVLERLREERLLRPRIVSGVPRRQVLAEIAAADIVVDQLDSETPGVFALEAMALGKPVLVQFRRDRLAAFAQSAPLVPVTAASLEAELRALCADASRRAALGASGRRYVTGVHEATLVAAAVERVYRHVRGGSPGTYEVTASGVTPLQHPARLPSAVA